MAKKLAMAWICLLASGPLGLFLWVWVLKWRESPKECLIDAGVLIGIILFLLVSMWATYTLRDK